MLDIYLVGMALLLWRSRIMPISGGCRLVLFVALVILTSMVTS
ncbi:hypothetical protein ACNKHU_08345 [Shigella flexneri]